MNETLYFSMSEASRRSNVGTATLRKWAARYGIDASHRSQGGHRLYSEADVERLCRIRELKERGWGLADLADLDANELEKMNPLENSNDIPGQICFSGPRVVAEFSPWFESRARNLDDAQINLATGVLVWEVGSLTDQHVTRVQRLVNAGVPVLMVYHYALNRRVKQLEACGATAQAGPLDWATLMRWLLDQSPKPAYSDGTLQRIAGTEPNLTCECPKHLAELLLKLRDFATYCQQCSMDSPAEAELHQRLYHWTLAAQTPLETGLSAVLDEEDLTPESSQQVTNIDKKAG